MHGHVFCGKGDKLLDHVGKVVVEGLADPGELNPHPLFVIIKLTDLFPVVALFEVLV